jgi:hypothetical protein
MMGPAHAQQTFKTPQEAAEALVSAVRNGDKKAILTVLGKDGGDISSSGDAVADANMRKLFVAKYQEKHDIAMNGDRTASMIIGPEDFPFPIPIVRTGVLWHFDAAAGRREILYRRIGRNELNAVQACLAYVDAQREYAAEDRGEGAGVYAQSFFSAQGKKNGLYWPTSSPGDDASPLGELFARATAQGYRFGNGRSPYNGYYFKILTGQGPAVQGGALDYVTHGKMIGGFALVAYPAEYRKSGVMTFIVNHDGVVFERDLGRHTSQIAGQMKSFNPDKYWHKTELTSP